MVLMNRGILFLAVIWTLTTSVFADVIHAKPSKLPAPQDSVFETPNAPDPAPRETDAGRWVIPLREVMQRTYDVAGQKSEWVLGTSILGSPELPAKSLGIGSLSKRYPSKLAGIYTTRLSYDASTLALNGENGILFEERHGIPVDTPITDVNWERGAFEGNALRLEFRRLITDSVTLDLGVSSHSDMLSKPYEYQPVTHSPFFALGRDSTQIPFGGRNIAMNSMHLQPIVTWRFGYGKAFVKINYLSLDNADNTTHKVLLDTLDPTARNFQTDPYRIIIESRTYGGGVEFYPIKDLTLGTEIHYGNHEIELRNLSKIIKGSDTTYNENGLRSITTSYYDTSKVRNYETILGNFDIRYSSFLNPRIRFEYEFLNTEESGHEKTKQKFYQDREIGYAEVSDTLFGKALFRVQAGMQRNSSLLDSVEFAPAFSIDGTYLLPHDLMASASYRHDNKFPDVTQLKLVETGRVAFPNENLKHEVRDRVTANLVWQKRDVFYGLGLRYEHANNLIKPHWAIAGRIDSTSSYDDINDVTISEVTDSVQSAFRYENLDHAHTLDWLMQVGFRLGNWKFYLERGQKMTRTKLIDTPSLYYKGSIHWQNRFVKDRLGVSVRVDFQWFNNRYDCTINEKGEPELVSLKKYLAMDFEARMQILSFELYNRIENFNHSIYAPESGYTPEGLRFAYGIVWTFGN
ncbi:hypothetical protein FSU_0245 [Fibrobacter succinogenes subsp. succinogenes S85]|uniref:TonB-dependent receptor-like beta-barrel domain-containing protein n=2 Tax=Fibrobacter succinogenes (strain ATCC 19169 / S85) TaxID=59374 RepID=D9S568_FIBSS|nr:hypothetical protein FSU_0245 [Fibrobacter succinogenes subsp. succinogenes S85]